ncbi:MAG: hypothetical protein CFE24_15130 [Flavobacterium sp. BFFFF2]|nr:MAG: hypothetical protein CFE24_15130 [Flavobacterium sp. BFFFF2]
MTENKLPPDAIESLVSTEEKITKFELVSVKPDAGLFSKQVNGVEVSKEVFYFDWLKKIIAEGNATYEGNFVTFKNSEGDTKINDVNEFAFKSTDILFVNKKRVKAEYYAIFDYYPKNRFPEVDEDIQQIRKVVYAFKDGNINLEPMVDYIGKLILNENFQLDNTILIPIPASTKAKTIIRYSKIIEPLAKKINAKNGYNFITTTDHEPNRGHAGGNKIEHFTFHHSPYSGLNVILIDDVRTSGTTFKQTAQRILELGANSVRGVFIAKTIGFN